MKMKKLNIIIATTILSIISASSVEAKSTTTTTSTVPKSVTTTTVKSSIDWIEPNHLITPGVINPNVTQANIKSNICKSGWTDTVRPSVSVTNKLKLSQMVGDYKYLTIKFGTDPKGYEEDHLISLQLGGSPTDQKNLWPQPYLGNNARKKDVIETKFKKMICAGTITLAIAQNLIANDWVGAYSKYVVSADTKNVESNG